MIASHLTYNVKNIRKSCAINECLQICGHGHLITFQLQDEYLQLYLSFIGGVWGRNWAIYNWSLAWNYVHASWLMRGTWKPDDERYFGGINIFLTGRYRMTTSIQIDSLALIQIIYERETINNLYRKETKLTEKLSIYIFKN